MFVSCKLIGHNWQPYRYNWVEFVATRDAPYNREGSYILSHVYCTKCGEVREAVNVGGNRIRYANI